MESIEKIRNHFKGQCILVGGGTSVNDFDFKSLSKDIAVIAINRFFIDIDVDIQIFTDPFFTKWSINNPIKDSRILIGPKNSNNDRVNFYFEFEKDVYEGHHTGYHGLQLAQYLGFEEIYLIGYDYYQTELTHYYEGNNTTEITENEKKSINQSFKKWIDDFNKIEWGAKIFNCNPESKLKKFIYQEVN